MWQAKWRCLWHFASWVPGVHLSSGRSAPFWPLRCSRVASWAVHSVYPVFPKHGPLQTGRFWAVYFLLKQSGITTKCNATKHALSSPWPSETFTRSRIASIKVSALHLQMLFANALCKCFVAIWSGWCQLLPVSRPVNNSAMDWRHALGNILT